MRVTGDIKQAVHTANEFKSAWMNIYLAIESTKNLYNVPHKFIDDSDRQKISEYWQFLNSLQAKCSEEACREHIKNF